MSTVAKYVLNQSITVCDVLFERGDSIYIQTGSYRNSGSSINWKKCFDSNKKLIGSITTDKFEEIRNSLASGQIKYSNLEESDIKHLEWIYDRMINVHGENPNVDYMLKMKSILNLL